MKKLLKVVFAGSMMLPIAAFADTTAPQTTTVANVQAATGATTTQAEIKNESTVVISPRTGIRYSLGNTGGRQIILKTAAIAAVTPTTINRVLASNPALSTASQEKVKLALLDASPVVAQAQLPSAAQP